MFWIILDERFFSNVFFLDFYEFFQKLFRLVLKVTKITTEHQKWHKMSQTG